MQATADIYQNCCASHGYFFLNNNRLVVITEYPTKHRHYPLLYE
jgi:hypothetical protein